MENMQLKLYCDESGNSGGNLTDLRQPFYVLAGWQVRDQQAGSIRIVTDLLSKLRIDQPMRKQFKGSDLINSRYAPQVAAVLQQLMKEGSMPAYQISEKKFVICAKIVETLMDPLFHEALGNEFSWEFDRKIKYANQIYELPDDFIHAFGDAYFEKRVDSLRDISAELANAIGIASPELSKMIEGGTAQIKDQFDFIVDQQTLRENKKSDSINVSSLIAFLNHANLRARDYGAYFDVLHDEVHTFQETYKWIIEKFTADKETYDLHLAPDRVIATHFDRISSFNFANEDGNPWLIAADFLASALYYGLKQLNDGIPIPSAVGNVLAHIFFILTMEGYHGHALVSDKFSAKLMKELVLPHFKS